jgi:hypothetical protein
MKATLDASGRVSCRIADTECINGFSQFNSTSWKRLRKIVIPVFIELLMVYKIKSFTKFHLIRNCIIRKNEEAKTIVLLILQMWKLGYKLSNLTK